MTDTFNIVRAAMHADAEAVRVIGQNVANAQVTAYQRQIPVNEVSFSEALDQVATTDTQTRIALDSQPGTLHNTGEPLHVALEGTGFFGLRTQDGIQLTRRGDFQVSADGVLTSASGKPVLGARGLIEVGMAAPTIGTDGTVRVGTEIVDQIRVFNVSDVATLKYVGDAEFMAPADQLIDADTAVIRQGYLETSNVTPVGEMVQLMETVRHFEASQRLARGYDDMLQKAISELGKVG